MKVICGDEEVVELRRGEVTIVKDACSDGCPSGADVRQSKVFQDLNSEYENGEIFISCTLSHNGPNLLLVNPSADASAFHRYG